MHIIHKMLIFQSGNIYDKLNPIDISKGAYKQIARAADLGHPYVKNHTPVIAKGTVNVK